MKVLTNKFVEILGWEQRKRQEQTIALVLCSALVLAIVGLPFNTYLPIPWLRWSVPGALFVILAPWFLYRARWRHEDGVRAVVGLDKTLSLSECAVTAWELSARPQNGGAALLVLQRAEAKLRDIKPRMLLPRRLSWPMYAVAPLLIFWVALLWFDFDQANSDRPQPGNRALAHKVREYSRELQERAKSEGLHQTLKLGQELEKTAQKSLDAKTPDEALKNELAGVSRKFETGADRSQQKGPFANGESEQNLKDLRAELEASRSLLADAAKPTDGSDQRWMERLAGLPQLKRQLDTADHGSQGIQPNEMKAFIDRLDQQVTKELDRRSIIDAQQYLEQMMKPGGQQKGENYARSGGSGAQDPEGERMHEKSFGNLPGKEPGKRDEEMRALPNLRPGASTEVKGQLGPGESSAVMLKGKPTAGKSELSDSEIVASYRRQAEQELNSERVPESLKETIRNYFMALEEAKR